MGRSKKASRRSTFLLLVVAGGITLWQLWERGDPERFVAGVVGVVWLLLVLLAVWVPTTCDVVSNATGRTCDNDAYGWLRACHRQAHKRDKRRALLAMLGFHRWASRAPRGWRRPGASRPARTPSGATAATAGTRSGSRPGAAEPVLVALARSAQDRVILVATVIGTIAGVSQVGIALL